VDTVLGKISVSVPVEGLLVLGKALSQITLIHKVKVESEQISEKKKLSNMHLARERRIGRMRTLD
jgi:hypothetical protein